MKTIKLFFLLVSIGFVMPVLAREKIIKGRVVDAVYHTPVPFAALYIEGTPIGTVADNVGEFSLILSDLPDASLMSRRLIVSHERFQLKYILLGDILRNISFSGKTIEIALHPDELEARIRSFQDSLVRDKGSAAAFLADAVAFVSNDWIPLGNPATNRFDLGRIQTFPTFNPIEGVRLRVGLASNTRLSPHFFVKGYMAYGFKDERLKYRGEAIYSFSRKAYHEDEFPKNNLRVVYEHDLYSPGDLHPFSPNDQLLFTYKRSTNEATYRNFAEINYEREYKNGLAPTLRIRGSRLVPQGALRFDRMLSDGGVREEKALQTTELGVLLRYSPREAYDQLKRKRIPLEITAPVFFFSHTVGLDNFIGGEETYHRTELSAQKRFVLGQAGRLDVVGEVMKVWSKVPFPLLVYPNQRYRHLVENKFFFLNRSLEFMADEQYTLRMVFIGDDLLFSKFAFTNILQMKELVALRASYGRLSDKNNPAHSPVGLYQFPSISRTYDKVPYVEGVVGITNILGLIRVEYVHRFTYRNHPNAILGAFRMDVTL